MTDLLTAVEQNLLAAQKSTGTVPLDATTLTGAGAAVVAAFQAGFGAPSFTFTGAASIDLRGDKLTVVGTPQAPVLGLTAPTVTAVLTTATAVGSGATVLDLVLTIPADQGWTLATTFPQLAGTTLNGLQFASPPTFVVRSSHGPADMYGPLEPPGLNVEATITVADAAPLDALDPILKLTQSSVAVAGAATALADAEALQLRTAPLAASIDMSVAGVVPLSLSGAAVVVQGQAAKGLDGWAAATQVSAWGAATIGGSAVAFSVAPAVGLAPWRLAVVPGLGVRLSQLLGVVPGLSVFDALPDAVRAAVDAEIVTFAFLLGGTSPALKPLALQIAVEGVAPWTIVENVVELKAVGVDLDVAFDNGPSVQSGSVSGTIALGDPAKGKGIDISTSVPIPLSGGVISVWANPYISLPGLGALTRLIGGADLATALPAGLADAGGFNLDLLSVDIDTSGPSIQRVGIGVSSDPWTIIAERLVLQSVALDVQVLTPFTDPGVVGRVSGLLMVGKASLEAAVQRYAADAHWELTVEAANLVLPSLDDLAQLAGSSLTGVLPDSISKQHFTLDDIRLDVDLTARALEIFSIQVSTDKWDIAPGYFAVDSITGALAIDWRSGAAVAYGSIVATLAFGDGAAQLVLSGERDQEGGWTLSGTLTDDVDLIELVGKALGLTPPQELGTLVVSPLSLTYRTKDDSYDFNAAAVWTPSIAAVQFELDATVELHRKPVPGKAGQFSYAGAISADLSAHFASHTLALSVGYIFQTQNSTTSYVFGLKYDQLSLTGTYRKAVNNDEIVTVRLGGVTFGGIVTYLVNLVDPDLHFSLGAPWDVLNKISFDNLSLTINLTQRSVGISYAVNANLGLIDIETIGLTYLHKGGSPTVEIEFTGSFLGQKYTPDKPLGWDMLNESPPTPSGQGSQLFDLRLLGIGQHLVLADPHADTMAKVIDDLADVVKQTKDSPKPWELLKFDPSAGWLFAADFTVMDTLTLCLVFDDPELYGVEIALAGAKAGPFAGLDFQILYRKLSDSLGVYHIALTLPDVMRHLEFGEVSVTLPNVVVDIYTDGSFYLDFGFPYNNDWTVCFGVQVFPFVGAGGFYFGKLSTAAAAGTDLVPKATNGTFGPVIEFGVALALGVGKSISEGPLSAGVSVTVQGVVTGVVSWFNPTDAAQGSDQYYKIEGSVAVVGQLYGRVDFKIITIDISVVASATVSLTVESYQPILIGLSLDVEVHASIKIVFFTIHFSFGLHLDASFTIGSAQATPWQLAAANGTGTQARTSLAAQRRAEHAHRVHAGARTLLAVAAPQDDPLAWAPAAVMGATPVPIDVELAPLFTPAANGTATVNIVIAAFVQTSSAASATHDTWREAVGAGDKLASELPFNVIAEALLKWGMNTLIGQHSGPITAVDLQLVYEDLCRHDIGATGFAYGNVSAFLAENIQLTLVPPPAPADDVARTVLPMPPPLQMAAPGLQQPVKFWETPAVGAGYQEELLRLADQLKVNFDYSRAHDPLAPAGEARAADDDGTEPITEALFGDWFLMVARSVVQSARSLLDAHDHELTEEHDDSLADLAALFAPSVQYTMRAGDTFASIAQLFGITTAQLVDDPANQGKTIEPGKTLTVPPAIAEVDYVTVPGDTVANLATAWHTHSDAIEAANPGVDFADLAAGTAIRIPVREELLAIADANLDAKLAAVKVPISGLRYQVRASDTLGAIATAYGLDADAVAEPNAGDATVLQTGATLQIARAGTNPASIPYTSVANDTLATLAALLLVRNEGSVEQAFGDDPSYNWIANAIPAYNPGVVFTEPVAAGVELQIPNVVLGPKGLQPSDPAVVAYTTKAQDTLPLIAATFVMTELRPTALAAVETAIKALNPTVDWTGPLAAGTALQLPGQAHEIAAGDTLADLAARFWLTVRDLALVNGGAQVLSPTASLALPAGMPVDATGTTVATLAAKLGLTGDELVGRIGAQREIFATPQKLKIQRARRYDVDELMQRIVDGGDANSAAGQASSFLLGGLRAPDPGAPSTYRALYDLTAQQFAGPAAPQDYTITFTAPTPPKWLVVSGGQVAVAITQAEMQQSWPATTLDPQIDPGYPTALPLGRAQPVRHPVGTPTPWAAPVPPTLSGPPPPAGGGPVLFPLPASATSAAANSPTPHQYELATTPKGRQADPTPVPTYAWATWVPFTVRRVPAAGGGWVEGAYVALGADQSGADTLLSLWTYLQSSGATATLTLAYQATSGTGLVSDALGPATALLKANLSTETHSPPAMLAALQRDTPAPATYALLTQAQQFVQLLWEATITGTGGFYLTYDTATHGPLPDAAFASGDDAQVFLIATLDEQTQPNAPDRALHPFTTGALVEGNLDPSRFDVFAQATDGSDMTEVAIVPPGNVGYVLERANPSGAAASPEDLTRGLYSMLAFTLSGELFDPPELVFPTGPVKDSDPLVWHYDRTIPVFRLVKTPPAALPGALPAAEEDPYAGVAAGALVTLGLAFRDRFGNELGDSAGSVGPIDVGYTDPVLGLSAWPSVTAAYAVGGPDGGATLSLTADLALAKYVPSPSNLYAAAVRTAAAHRTTYKQVYFQLRRADVTATLATSLDAPGAPCLPSAELKPLLLGLATAAYVYLGAAAAAGQAELPVRQSPAQTLAGQAADLVVTAAELAEANAAADASQLFSGALTIPVLRVVRPSDTLAALAGAADLTVAALLDQNEDVPLNPGTVVQTAVRTYTTGDGDTLTSIAELEDTSPALLAIANSGTPGLLQPQTVTLGTFSLDITGTDTFATLVTKLDAYDPTMTVAGAGELLANVAKLFVPQTTIAIAASPVSPDDATGARACAVGPNGEALAAIAERVGCTALGLALANGQRPGVLDPTATVDVEGVTVPVGAGGTILSVTLALRAQSVMVGIAEVTAAIQSRTDLLVPNAELAVVDHVVQNGETIASVPALAVPVLSLFAANAPPNVFATGTALTVSSSQYRPQAGDTLTEIAAANGLKLDQLAAAIGDATLTPGAPVVVPGGMTADTDAPVPYQVPTGATTPTIAAVATTFGSTAGELGTLNAAMPGLLAAGIEINYPGHTLTTTDTSTLGSLAAEAGVAVDVFTADQSVAANARLVAPGALFACPLPPVKGSLDDMAEALGVLPLDLASANSALMGLVAPTHQFAVTVPSSPKPVIVTVTSGTEDTLQSLVRRVQAQAPSASLADLVASCGGDQGALVQGVSILAPPAAVAIEAKLAEPVAVASTFAPLDVGLTIARDPALVAPEFASAADVATNATTIAPALGDPPNVVPFATAFEAAFTTRRLKLATGPQSAAGTPQLWVVDFGTGGLAEIAVQGEDARFYAVAPMSRTLAGGQASIKPYDPKTGKLGSPVQQTIASADLDSWMRIALGAIDLVLSPVVATAVWRQEAACLNSLVASKQTIAGALRDRVAEILQDAAPDAAALGSASEALYQSMLVSLASAYTTDAVVTYPVTVQSPFTATYTTGATDGFDEVATGYGVSPEGVAEGLADVPSILAQVTVTANGRPYAIAADETLRTLATAIGVDVMALPAAVTVPASTPLFAPATTLAQSAMTRTVATGDTFATLGAYFGTDPGSVGLAARLVPGLVPQGRTVTVDGAQYPVQQGDTLTAIAAALSQAAGHTITVQAVATAPGVVDDATLLAENAVVHCFSPANLVAPRLSGKASAQQYRVQLGDGMDALVAWYEVSLEALADALADAQILNAGMPDQPVTATWSSHSAALGAADTLTTLATTLGAPDVLTLLAGITIAPAGAGLLRPGIRVPLGRVTRTPSASDSFASLAAYFEDDPGSFAVANQDRPGVLAGGTELQLGEHTYQVKDTDSLVDVATGLGTTPADLAVAAGIGDRTGIFAASPVYDLQVLPEFSLSTAKTPLAAGTSYVSFLFGTNADASFKSLFLDVGYDVAELETDIRNIPGAGDYQASEWLRLAVPLGASAFGGAVDLAAGQTQVPIPLRAFPLLPSIVDLAAEAAWPAPTTIAEAKQWELMAAVQHQSAAQDAIQLEVTFGSVPSFGDGDGSPALFDALAQFVTAWPEMQTDVAALAAMPAGTRTDKMQSLAESLATLAADLATAMTQPPLPLIRDAVPGQRFDFRLEPTIDHSADPPVLDLFDLTVTQATAPDDVPWPTVYLSDPAQPLRRVPQTGSVMRYFYDGEKPPAFQSLTQHYVFPGDTPGRDAVAFQTGQVAAAVQRNADLVTTAQTADAFLYQTPWVTFAAAAVPLLETAAPIAIGTGPDLTAPLTSALTALLTLQGDDSPAAGPFMVRLLVTYERTLAGANGSAPITMSQPVVYVPQWSLAGDAIATLAGDLAAQATTWFSDTSIQQHPGDMYVIDLSVFATADVAMTRPLVETSRLTVPLA